MFFYNAHQQVILYWEKKFFFPILTILIFFALRHKNFNIILISRIWKFSKFLKKMYSLNWFVLPLGKKKFVKNVSILYIYACCNFSTASRKPLQQRHGKPFSKFSILKHLEMCNLHGNTFFCN